MSLTITAAKTSRSASLRLAGEVDYQSTGSFVDTVDELIGRRPAPADLHLDLSELTFCDPAGLSGLLLAHRRTSQAGVRLHLEHRPQFLDQILDITGTFEHLVTSNAAGETGVR
ncbi:STAS domain-containing protein [Mycobacterium sp. 050134]|uniref:STAS domain-containing protein n=1 Tax=Mycobacterium sp. 050134 TaxID=3096111 RepID=UPI002EDAE951